METVVSIALRHALEELDMNNRQFCEAECFVIKETAVAGWLWKGCEPRAHYLAPLAEHMDYLKEGVGARFLSAVLCDRAVSLKTQEPMGYRAAYRRIADGTIPRSRVAGMLGVYPVRITNWMSRNQAPVSTFAEIGNALDIFRPGLGCQFMSSALGRTVGGNPAIIQSQDHRRRLAARSRFSA